MGKIVVADDSDLDRALTQRALKKFAPECEVYLFEDGEGAVEYLRENPDVGLVLLDHRMPRMGALEVLAALKPEPGGAAFVLFSSAVSPTNVQRCLELGAREYVEKPTDPTAYVDLVCEMASRYCTRH